MAMVRVSGVLLGIGMLMLSGCVVGHGPFLGNALDVSLDLTVRHADGQVRNKILASGVALHIGTADWENDPYTAVPIEEVVIKEAGQLLHQFNAEEVRFLIEKRKTYRGGPRPWCVDRESVYLFQPDKRYPDRDANRPCSKGNRLWTWKKKFNANQKNEAADASPAPSILPAGF